MRLRLKEKEGNLVLEVAHKVSCPICEKEIILPEDAKAGDKMSCCGREFVLTYEFGAYALE